MVVADASNLRRSIFLLTQLMDMNKKIILALNMVDVAFRKGIIIDIELLSDALEVEVVAINARKREGIEELKKKIVEISTQEIQSHFLDIKEIFPNIITAANEWNINDNDYTSFLLLCREDLNCPTKNRIGLDQLYKRFDFIPERAQAKETVRRYKHIDKIINHCVRKEQPQGRYFITKILDIT